MGLLPQNPNAVSLLKKKKGGEIAEGTKRKERKTYDTM